MGPDSESCCRVSHGVLPLMLFLFLVLCITTPLVGPYWPVGANDEYKGGGEERSLINQRSKPNESHKFPWQGMCRTDTEHTEYGTFVWPAIRAFRTTYLDCPFGVASGMWGAIERRPKANRKCWWDWLGPKWDKPDYSACRSKPGLTPEQAIEVAQNLDKETSNPDSIRPETLGNTTEMLDRLISHAIREKEVARSVMSTISNLMSAQPGVLEDGDADGAHGQRIFTLLNVYTSAVNVAPLQVHSFSFKNLELQVHVQNEGNHTEHSFRPRFNNGENQPASITIPAEASRVVVGPSGSPGLVRVHFVALRNARFLHPPGAGGLSSEQIIISASLSKHTNNQRANATMDESTGESSSEDDADEDSESSVTHLQTPVSIRLPWNNPGTTHFCAYYSTKNNTWMRDGVRTTFTDKRGVVVCESSHLTAFSLLLDANPRRDLGALRVPLDILSYAGSTLSVFGLGATVITYYFFRLGCDRWGRVLVQLCLSLFLLHVAVMLSGLKGILSPMACCAVAVAVHTLVMVALSWMLVEALLLHQLLITVFQPVETKFMLKRIILAWGVPMMIVTGTAGYDFRYYGDTHPDYCVSSGQLLGLHTLAMIAPCGAILLANVTIFLMVARVLLRQRNPPGQRVGSAGGASSGSGGPQPRVSCAQIRGVVGVAFLLGITWFLSPISFAGPVLQVCSSVANSLQGLAIFLSRVVFHPEARRSWSRAWRRVRPLSKQPGPRSSASYSLEEKGSLWRRLQRSIHSDAVAKPPKGSWWPVLQRRQSRPLQTTSAGESSSDPQQLQIHI